MTEIHETLRDIIGQEIHNYIEIGSARAETYRSLQAADIKIRNATIIPKFGPISPELAEVEQTPACTGTFRIIQNKNKIDKQDQLYNNGILRADVLTVDNSAETIATLTELEKFLDNQLVTAVYLTDLEPMEITANGSFGNVTSMFEKHGYVLSSVEDVRDVEVGDLNHRHALFILASYVNSQTTTSRRKIMRLQNRAAFLEERNACLERDLREKTEKAYTLEDHLYGIQNSRAWRIAKSAYRIKYKLTRVLKKALNKLKP